MHVTMDPESALDSCQGIILGEGDDTIVELMEALEQQQAFMACGTKQPMALLCAIRHAICMPT